MGYFRYFTNMAVGAPFIGSSLIIIMLLLFRVEKKMPQIRAELEERRKKASA